MKVKHIMSGEKCYKHCKLSAGGSHVEEDDLDISEGGNFESGDEQESSVYYLRFLTMSF